MFLNRIRYARIVSRGVIAVSMACVLGGSPAGAQALGAGERGNIPSGSPMQGGNGGSDDASYRPRANTTVIDPTGGASPISPVTISDSDRYGSSSAASLRPLDPATLSIKPPATPGEFESYVERAVGRPLKRFGAELLVPGNRDFATPATATVPPDYVLNVGDTISIALTGSVEGSVDKQIDTDGRIFLPKVGSITVAGVRYASLRDVIAEAIGRQYRGYTVTVGVRQLRGIRVYVTGFANNPGAFSVNSLSTMVNAILAAGGPAAGGSFRSAKLYRAGREVADFDLYDVIRKGDRSNDAVLQNEDVLFIPPVGQQIAVVGSVNEEAIYEARPGETIAAVLGFAGGPNTLADPSRVILYRLAERDRSGGQEVGREQAASFPAAGGDIVQVLSKGSLQQPLERQSVLVRIEGEVNAPGNYFVAPNTPMDHVVALAGGLTPRAFVYGAKLQRVSVRAQQRESYAEAIKQLEITLAAAPLTGDQSIGAGDRAAQVAGARAVLDRLRTAEPDGRIVLDLTPASSSLPADLVLENNDHIVIPPRVTTVGVFGAVYRPASFLLNPAQPLKVQDYVVRAGGPLRSADKGGIFVVRANGEVLPKRNGAMSSRALPGDVVFVPVKTQSGSFWAKFREISTVLFQLGLSAATVVAVTK